MNDHSMTYIESNHHMYQPMYYEPMTHHSNGLDELLSQNSGCEFEMYGNVSQSNENCGCCTICLYYVRKE